MKVFMKRVIITEELPYSSVPRLAIPFYFHLKPLLCLPFQFLPLKLSSSTPKEYFKSLYQKQFTYGTCRKGHVKQENTSLKE